MPAPAQNVAGPSGHAADPSGVPALLVQGLTYQQGGRALFDGLDLTLAHGESIAIIGASGSGKSTLLEVVLGHRPVGVEGRIEVDRERAALVTQDGALLDHLNVIDNLRLVGIYRQRPRSDAELAAFLDRLNIPANYAERPVYTLSGGEKRRVAIARALVCDPEIVCFDEPDAGLDPANIHDLGRALRRLSVRESKTVVLATHDSLLAALVSTRIYVLTDGKLIERLNWPAPPADSVQIEQRRAEIEAIAAGFALPASSSVSARERPGTGLARELVTGIGATLLSALRPNPSPRYYLRMSARTLYAAAISGVVFYFLVGAMLGATTVVVINNVSEQAIPEFLKLVIRRDFVLHQLNGMYIAYFSPAIGGILFIARSGSIVTSWLGALAFGKQLAALRSLGVNPDLYLRSPIFVALVVSYLLTIVVFGLGMWVGSFTTAEYLYHIQGAARQLMVTMGMVQFAHVPAKVAIYGVAIGAMICTLGMAPKANVDAVARHTTQTIIFTTVVIALCELVFALWAT